ncbi:flavin-containing monooxygenase [Microbacterium sp. NPDC089698]|uniref:flavin-containing monooxygenase n=1 Tax=Microbacterium sp. NPDC089698 TaxID=3364200 RepID=UPI0038069079
MPDLADTEMTEVDLTQLRAKYRRERDRRIRPDGLRQYTTANTAFGYWTADPYIHRSARAPRSDNVEVLIVGGGFGGLLTAAKLRERGFSDVCIVEEGGDFGGTWYWNRYPGIHCDIEASVYMPLLEEVGTTPTRRYAPGEEIRQHAVAIARHYDLYDDALFHTRVQELRWDDDTEKWQVRTDQGDVLHARHVVVSSGSLSQPKLPSIEGIDRFQGHTFHTSRWDYEYTGGDQTGGLTRLADKRVAVVGTGATGIQVIPHVASDAAQLFVFQRTPSSVDERANCDLPAEWTKNLAPGWQQERMDNFLAVVSGEETRVDLIRDGWTSTAALQRTMLTGHVDESLAPGARDRMVEVADARKMAQIRARVDEVVRDPETAARLKPWYRYMCKRPTFSDHYLQAFNRPNVTLVDTADFGGITAMTETGIVVGETEYDVDCVIFATGFDTGVSGVVSGTLPVFGVSGIQLLDTWSAEGPRTLHGFYSHGFPNLYHLGSLQNANSVNFVHLLQEQATHIAAVLDSARKRGESRVEPSTDAEDAWLSMLEAVAVKDTNFLAECTPGYYNGEGTRSQGMKNYAPGPVRFHRLLREWRQTSLDEVFPSSVVEPSCPGAS